MRQDRGGYDHMNDTTLFRVLDVILRIVELILARHNVEAS